MSLSAGTKVGPYEILSPLGAGGMGEVYRARDAKLNREVAIKVLPEAFAADVDRLARFRREAQLLAALNHPHVASIYGLEESGSVEALVLELVPGETLAERLATGPLPLEEAVEIARQIAEALEAAHERGIVHRDLKPANVKLTSDGKVKVLDFGLAKALAGDASSPDVSMSPTLTAQATQAGVVIGTAAYMSPEQARGRSVDKRADVWAWGCVLYEMLTGRRCFEGETVSDTLAAVLRAEPDWSLLPPGTSGIRNLLRRCLEKDPKQRLHDIADARLALIDSPSAVAETAASGTTPGAESRLRRRAVASSLVAFLLGGALVAGFLTLRSHGASSPPAVRLDLGLPPGQTLEVDGVANFAVSRDGTRVAYIAKSESGADQLYVRPLSSFDAKPLPDTEGGSKPFFSPDGQWLGYAAGTNLRKVSVSGGPPLPVCDAPGAEQWGAAWADDGSIFFPSTDGGLRRAAPDGTCVEVVKPQPGRNWILQPEALPGGRALLFASVGGFQMSQARIEAYDLRTGKSRVIVSQGTNPRYVDPGFLLFGRGGAVLAAPFDAKELKLLGDPVPLVENVLGEPADGLEQFAVSRSGVLAYLAGKRAAVKRRIVTMDPKGASAPLTAEDNAYEDMSLSPDGRRLAMTVEGPSWNIWTYDRDRGTLTRLTFENDNRDPIWSPDGKRIVYTSLRDDGLYGLYWRAADGSGREERLVASKNWIFAGSWSPDGRFLAYGEQDPATGHDIEILPMEGDRKPYPFAKTSFREWFAEFSRDGKWIAYESNESGRDEIYVRPFPGPGGKWQVSMGGGARPEWSRDGRELFYLSGGGVMRVPVEAGSGFSAGRPERVLSCNCFESGRYYEVAPDAKSFFFIQSAQPPSPVGRISVVLDWRGELERRLRAEGR